MTAARLLSLLLIGLGWLLAAPAAPAEPAKPAAPSFDLVKFDRDGDPRDTEAIEALVKRFTKEQPTDIFLAAHGWNTTTDQAERSDRRMIELMQGEAERRGLRPDGFRPAVVGLHWPSLAFDGDEELVRFLINLLPEQTRTGIRGALRLQFIPKNKRFELFRLIRPLLERELGLPKRGDNLDLTELDGEDVKTLLDMVRVFTFWEMKERSGNVGAVGGRKLLEQLQIACPKARIHLLGHSFGCKLWLAALAGEKPLPRPVDTLILLQAAVSAQAFAEKIVIDGKERQGGYRIVVSDGRVRGPIVATFTTRDHPIHLTYPLGSRAAGHVGELDGRLRNLGEEGDRGMGAWGIVGVKSRPFLKPGEPYGFKQGLYSIDAKGTRAITGHTEYFTPEVAWLIWAAVLRK